MTQQGDTPRADGVVYSLRVRRTPIGTSILHYVQYILDMTSHWSRRPPSDEYGSYHEQYVQNVGGNVIDVLKGQRDRVEAFIRSLTEQQASYRYEDRKWTVKEMLVHVIDNERIYSYRALSIARNCPEELMGYDQDEYVRVADSDGRSMDNIGDEYRSVRESTLHLFAGFTDEELTRTGVADGVSLSVRAVPFIIAGHEAHHMSVLQDRYGMTIPS